MRILILVVLVASSNAVKEHQEQDQPTDLSVPIDFKSCDSPNHYDWALIIPFSYKDCQTRDPCCETWAGPRSLMPVLEEHEVGKVFATVFYNRSAHHLPNNIRIEPATDHYCVDSTKNGVYVRSCGPDMQPDGTFYSWMIMYRREDILCTDPSLFDFRNDPPTPAPTGTVITTSQIGIAVGLTVTVVIIALLYLIKEKYHRRPQNDNDREAAIEMMEQEADTKANDVIQPQAPTTQPPPYRSQPIGQ